MTYTKGAWRVGAKYSSTEEYPILLGEEAFDLARVYQHNGEQEANAQLIAAAPRMYELLSELVEIEFFTDDENYEELRPILDDAREVVDEVGGNQ